MSGHTPGPWDQRRPYNTLWDEIGPRGEAVCVVRVRRENGVFSDEKQILPDPEGEANARLIAAAPGLLEALHAGRRAIGNHSAPGDCYATGPMTGDPIKDLVQCPACIFIEMYDAAIAKAEGRAANGS